MKVPIIMMRNTNNGALSYSCVRGTLLFVFLVIVIYLHFKWLYVVIVSILRQQRLTLTPDMEYVILSAPVQHQPWYAKNVISVGSCAASALIYATILWREWRVVQF
jgi:hypothetical protein